MYLSNTASTDIRTAIMATARTTVWTQKNCDIFSNLDFNSLNDLFLAQYVQW